MTNPSGNGPLPPGLYPDNQGTDVDYEWTDQAADRYALSLSGRQKALAAVQSKLTSVIGHALSDVASALCIFYGAVIAAIVALVVGIVFATGEAVSILGPPAVPPTVIVAIVAAIALISSALLNLRSSASSANTVFVKVATESGDFGGDNWPAAAVG